MTKTILILFGTRPELIKLYPLIQQIRKSNLKDRLLVVNTGQHKELLNDQLEAFQLKVDHTLNLDLDQRKLTNLLARTLEELQTLYSNYSNIEHVIVQGDTNTVLAASNFCFLNKLKLLHVEAGLRSGNLEHPFPEEFNRIVCSLAAHHHFAPTNLAKENLILEGISPDRISVTGNTVIDSLELSRVQISNTKQKRFLITLHRRENIESIYIDLIQIVDKLSKSYPDFEFIWIAHPNCAKLISEKLKDCRVQFKAALPYFEFLELLAKSSVVITDSGGVTEEAASLGIPTVIFRKCTERTETLESENPTIISTKDQTIEQFASQALDNKGKPTQVYGDGKASERILHWLQSEYKSPYVENLIVGGGIAGTGILLNLMKHGTIDSFLNDGFALIEKTDKLVCGNLPSYHVNSDTLADVFLECLEGETSKYINLDRIEEHTQFIKKYSGSSIPLNKLSSYFEALGLEIENYISKNEHASIYKNTEVLRIQKIDEGYKVFMSKGKSIACKNLILACGGKPIYKKFNHLKATQVHSDQLLKNQLKLNNRNDLDRNTVILGGSHSGFSVADYLLRNHSNLFQSEGSITIFTNSFPKIFYPSIDEAIKNGYTDFSDKDICPETQKLYRLAGLRMDGRDLCIKMIGLNGELTEKRVKILLIQENQALFEEKMRTANLIVHSTGYQFNIPNFIDNNGNTIDFKGEKDRHWVDDQCRLFRSNGTILENVYLTGLATGFIPSGELGGESTFKGQTNGLWYYQNAIAERILNNLMNENTASLS